MKVRISNKIKSCSVSSTTLLEVHKLRPSLVLEFEEFVGAPINSENLVGLAVRDCWNCKREAVDGHLHPSLLAYPSGSAKCKTLVEVLPTEAAHDNNSLTVKLCSSEPLSSLDRLDCIELVLDFNFTPVGV